MGERIRSSATTIARTETNGATNGGAIVAAQESGVVQGKTWVAALDERTRDTHLEAHDQTVPLDQDFAVGAGVGPSPGQIGLAEEDINCFPAGTIVYAENVHAAMKRFYHGPMVTITLRDRVFAVTPNHPLLTDSGWKVAGDIAEGDDLVGYSLIKEFGLASPYPYNTETEISEVFGFATVSGHSRRIAGSGPQFHGDGFDSNVDIVWPDSQLLNAGNPTVFDPSRQDILAASNINSTDLLGGSTGGQFSVSSCLTSDGSVRSGGESLSLVGAGLRHAEVHGVASPSWSDPVLTQSGIDGRPTRAELAGKRLYRQPGVVTLNKVIGVDIVPFDGHVYNLHTESNHYTANGIITHNCRCFLNFVLDTQEMPT
jgi:hypothetical protein